MLTIISQDANKRERSRSIPIKVVDRFWHRSGDKRADLPDNIENLMDKQPSSRVKCNRFLLSHGVNQLELNIKVFITLIHYVPRAGLKRVLYL